MEDSILKSTKKLLGIPAEHHEFDADIVMFVNSAFFTLSQLGVAPLNGVMIEDDSALWSELFEDFGNLQAIKTYVYLKVRMAFDPPGTTHHINAMQEQIKEHEHRLLTDREGRAWVAPQQPLYPPADLD